MRTTGTGFDGLTREQRKVDSVTVEVFFELYFDIGMK